MPKFIWWLFGAIGQPFKRNKDEYHCPWCNYEHNHEGVEFAPSLGGRNFDGEHIRYWAEGVATCPQCGHKFDYSAES